MDELPVVNLPQVDQSKIVESLVELLYALPDDPGFQVGMDQILKAECLLAAMTVQGTLPADNQRLCYLVAPIICTSPAEQRDLYRLFEQRVLTPHLPLVPSPVPNPNPELVRERRMGRLGLVLVPTLLLATALWVTWNDYKANPSRYSPVKPKTAEAEAVARVDRDPGIEAVVVPPTEKTIVSANELIVVAGDLPPEPIARWVIFVGYGSCVLLSVVALWIWWRWKLFRATAFLQRQSTTRQPSILAAARLNSMSNTLFANSEVSTVARYIRQRSTVPSTRLDVEKTVEATSQRSGTFSPRFGTRSVSPEYLVLVERQSRRDHMAELVEAFLERLQDEEVHVDRYWYVGDPRFCQAGESNQSFALDSLVTRHADSRLVLCGRAAAFINKFTGQLAEWTQVLERWTQIVLLTPDPVREWGYDEWSVGQAGIVVLPISPDGIVELATQFSTSGTQGKATESFAPRLPSFISDNEETWLAASAPPEEQISRLLDELSYYLGRKGLLWLAACAVYPELNWDLTLYLGQRVVPGHVTISNITSLSRLPWFRTGRIPDWLRDKLIGELTGEQLERVRFAIDGILLHAIRGDKMDGAGLEIAWDNRNWLATVGDRISRRLRLSEHDEPAARDYVFANFVETERASRLGYRVSQQLVDFLRGRTRRPAKKRSVVVQILRPIYALAIIVPGVLGVIALFRDPGTEIPITPTSSVAAAGPGYGADLKTAVEKALEDLDRNRAREFVRNMFPKGEFQYLETDDDLTAVVAQVLSNLARPNEQPVASMLADLRAIRDFLGSGGEPTWNEDKTVATFVIQRRDMAGRDGEAMKTAIDATKPRIPIVLVKNLKQGKAPPAKPQSRDYTVTCRLQLVDGSWRFFDGADQLRRVQNVLIRQSGLKTKRTQPDTKSQSGSNASQVPRE